MNPALLALREQIDAVDRELLALLNRRAGLALEVGEIKKHEGSPVFRPEREAQVIEGLKRDNAGPLKNASIAPIWREVMSACRSLESPSRVAYLGPAGTFSEQAALGYFGSSIECVPCASIDEVFRAACAGGAGGELHRGRGGAFAGPVPAHTLVHRGRDQPAGAPQPDAQDQLGGGHHRSAGPPAGAGAVPGLVVAAPAAG
jgi:chorismate mutase-like protein